MSVSIWCETIVHSQDRFVFISDDFFSILFPVCVCEAISSELFKITHLTKPSRIVRCDAVDGAYI